MDEWVLLRVSSEAKVETKGIPSGG